MSILFAALNRAAHAHRDAATAAATPRLGSGMTAAASGMPWWLAMLGGLMLGIGGAGLWMWQTAPITNSQPIAISPPFGKEEMPAASSSALMPAVKAGISLDAQALAIPAPLLDEVTAKIDPVLNPPGSPSSLRLDAASLEQPALEVQITDGMTPADKADALQQSGNIYDAAALWRKLQKESPADPAIRAGFAAALAAVNTPEARAELDGLIAAWPQFAPAYAAKAAARAKLGDLDAAQNLLEQAFALNRNPDYRLNLAIIADRRGNAQQALALYREALAERAQGAAAAPVNWPMIQARIDYLEGKGLERKGPAGKGSRK
ncbi:MAG: tetratricopeptide repeat protein [Alphaproteobacteria bacterium]